ncbi:FAD-dependent oxidoreductase [Arthrobacter luteolus]|uniref:oxidoreductase n=1 Tax=Arthrobacter luteolus TaxID=98672 RepID=UPI00384D441D
MPDDPRLGVRSFPHVFSPGGIGGLALPHRIIMGSMHLNFESNPQALAAFYGERAAAGAALIVTGGAAVNRDGSGGSTYLVSAEKPFLKAARSALEAVHDAGGRLALQLFHAGRYGFQDTYGLQPLAPSAVWSAYSSVLPRAMNESDIARTVQDFAAAASLARELGFDAVEIMGSEGYLVNQFASPLTNLRDDEWGGDAERRQAFPLAVLAAVREGAGSGFPVIFRMSGDDLVEGSGPPREHLALAAALARAGADALNIGIGWHESRTPTVQALVPHGSWLPVAGRIRRNLRGQGLSVPVIGSNRINSVAQAEAVLTDGTVDFVSMARPFLADPRILAKTEAGRMDLVNTCIACNEACIDRSLGTEPVSCLVNPRAGRELDYPAFRLTGRISGDRARAAVVGGGPAGMQAAATLAAAGIQVVLFEAEAELGGQFRLARLVPGKADFDETIRYFSVELPRLGVKIRTGFRAGAVHLAGFDHVLDATGVLPRAVRLAGSGSVPVLDYHQAFADPAALPGRVAVVGAGGIAVDLAHLLLQPHALPRSGPESTDAARARFAREHLRDGTAQPGGRCVTLLRRGGRIGEGIGPSTRWAALQALRSAGVRLYTGVSYRGLAPGGLEITAAGGTEELIPAEAVIVAAGQVENTRLQRDLRRAGVPHTVIGGAASAAGLNAVRAFAQGLEAGTAVAQQLAGVTRERKRAPLP